MILLLDRNQVIVAICKTAETVPNGILVDGFTVYADVGMTLEDSFEVPSFVVPQKYCYTADQGFYTNDNYVEPVDIEYIVRKIKNDLETADQKYKEIDLTTVALADVKAAKIAQLDELCSKAIIDGFDYTINGTSYHFSCSLSAQANFTGTDILFKDNLITEAEWTVTNNATGKEERVILDQPIFNNIKLQVFQHINSKVAKFRNTLQSQVEAATTNAQVDAVVW
jgi:hypothetical protein